MQAATHALPTPAHGPSSSAQCSLPRAGTRDGEGWEDASPLRVSSAFGSPCLRRPRLLEKALLRLPSTLGLNVRPRTVTPVDFGGRTRTPSPPKLPSNPPAARRGVSRGRNPSGSHGGCRQLYILCLYIMDFVTCFLVLI